MIKININNVMKRTQNFEINSSHRVIPRTVDIDAIKQNNFNISIGEIIMDRKTHTLFQKIDEETIKEFKKGGEGGDSTITEFQVFKDIFNADTDPNKRGILVLTDKFNDIKLNPTYIGGIGTYYRTSDGKSYDVNTTHNWDKSKDIKFGNEYIRWIIIYKTDNSFFINTLEPGANAHACLYMFFGNNSLLQVTLGTNVVANQSLISRLLKLIEFDNTVKFNTNSMINYSLYGCYSLTHINIAKGALTLGNDCFANCVSLRYVKIPDTIKTCGTTPFGGCVAITFIDIDDGWIIPNNFNLSDSRFFTERSAIHLFTKAGTTTNVTTLVFGSNFLNSWSEETKKIATDKGYTLT
jgi:hypothetical protein